MDRLLPAEILAQRSLIAVAPYAQSGDLLDAADGVVIAALDTDGVIDLDADGRALLNAWTQRDDRVFAFSHARPALRRLLRAGVDVARPVCRATLAQLARDPEVLDRTEASDRIARTVEEARNDAQQTIHKLEGQLSRVEAAGHKRVARLESLVLRAFAALEDRGLAVDVDGWRALVKEEEKNATAARDAVFRLAGDAVPRDLFGTPDINLDAEADVKKLVQRVTGAAVFDVSKYSLKALGHAMGPALLEYREAQKVVSTYGETFLSRVDPRTGRIHATFIPLGASTGRVASRDPNLQNLPSDARFHKCLCAPPGRVLVTADYATCELRIVAELAQDPVFLEAFDRGEDLHATVATTMFKKKVSKTENPELRQRAKGINFGLVYGMGAAGLASTIGASVDEAKGLLEQYFKTFPRIRDFLEGSVDRALQKGYAETILGRRMVFAKEALASDQARGELGRIAKNMPIQGTSADMTKLAMVRIHERLLEQCAGRAGLVNTIHDELVVECDEADGAAVAAAVQQEMEDAHKTLLTRVPPSVEVHVGKHWMH